MRGVTYSVWVAEDIREFLLTRLMRGVTARIAERGAHPRISTHTPHARRDPRFLAIFQRLSHFYSHASCEA